MFYFVPPSFRRFGPPLVLRDVAQKKHARITIFLTVDLTTALHISHWLLDPCSSHLACRLRSLSQHKSLGNYRTLQFFCQWFHISIEGCFSILLKNWRKMNSHRFALTDPVFWDCSASLPQVVNLGCCGLRWLVLNHCSRFYYLTSNIINFITMDATQLYNGGHLQRRKRFTLSRKPVLTQPDTVSTVSSPCSGPNLCTTTNCHLCRKWNSNKVWKQKKCRKNITNL